MAETALDALLCAFHDSDGHPVQTLESLSERYDRVGKTRILSLLIELVRHGWIRQLSTGGYVITDTGIEHYLAE